MLIYHISVLTFVLCAASHWGWKQHGFVWQVKVRGHTEERKNLRERERFLLLSGSLCILTCSNLYLVELTLNICNYSVLREGYGVVCVSALYVPLRTSF